MKKSMADYLAPKKEEAKAESGKGFDEMRLLRLAERVFEPAYDSESSRTDQLLKRVEALKLLIAACK
jgi:hypothetical protein